MFIIRFPSSDDRQSVSSLLLLNISILESGGQMVDFNNRSFKQESPVFETLCGDSSGEPSAREHNNPIAFTDSLGMQNFSWLDPLSLRSAHVKKC